MSGESSGLILVPLLLAGAFPLVVGGLAVAGVAAAASAAINAANNRNQRNQIQQNVRNNMQQNQGYYQGYNQPTMPPAQPIQRPQINTTVAENKIGNFRVEMNQAMNNQAKLNAQTFDTMMNELNMQRAELNKIAQQNDIAAFQEYLGNIKNARTQSLQNIYKAQNDFNTGYKKEIAETMSQVTQNINQKY